VTWDGIRGTIQWLLLLLLAAVLAAMWGAVHLWSAKDALLQDAVEAKLAEALPDCDVGFASLRLQDASHLEVQHLTLLRKSDKSRLLSIPRVLIEFDRDILKTHRRVVIHSVAIQSPELYANREVDGRWNWDGIRLPTASAAPTPRCTIQDGSIQVAAPSAAGELALVTCRGVRIEIEPEAHRRCRVSLNALTDALGPLQLGGVIDGNSGEWSVTGDAGGILLNDPLLDLAGRFVPELGKQLAALGSSQQGRPSPRGGPSALRTASLSGTASTEVPAPVPAPGALMRADVSVKFEFHQSGREAPLSYTVTADVHNGRISEELLPIPLYDLEGHLRVTPDEIRIERLSAANGNSTLFVNGVATRHATDWSKDFQVRATQLRVDERIRAFLPPRLLKLYNLLNPAGTFDVDVDLIQRQGTPYEITLRRLAILDCRALCEYFQYPVEKIHGEIRQIGRAFEIQAEGLASGHPVAVTGTVDPLNDETGIQLTIHGEDIPADSTFVDAFCHPKLEKVHRTLQALRVTGTCSGDVQILRNSRTEGQVKVRVHAHLRDGMMNYELFPYRLTQLSGRVIYDPLERDAWLFENLQARHGDAEIQGRGVINLELDPIALGLELKLSRILIDDELQRASVAAASPLRKVWDEFHLAGLIDVDRLELVWQPERPIHLAMRTIRWRDGIFVPKAFPYRWDNLAGALDWTGDRLIIRSLTGWHGNTLLNIDGTKSATSSYIDIPRTGDILWRLHLEDLRVVKLEPDDELKHALPVSISAPLKATGLKNPVDLQLDLDMKGWKAVENLVTAEWRLLGVLNDNSLTAGLPMTGVTGKVKIQRGSWDGGTLAMEGYMELDRADAMGIPFRKVRGPFLVEDSKVSLGYPKPVGRMIVHSEENPYRQEQLKAEIYGGQVGLDVNVDVGDFNEAYPFTMELNVQDVELAEWARDRNLQAGRLKGKVNAHLKANGFGSTPVSTIGEGWVQVTPAALYELPVFAQLFTFMKFRQVGDSAFNYAYGEFKIHSGTFDFSRIELVGDAMNLVGRGTVGYAGAQKSICKLDFYSKATNPNPFLKPLVEAFGSNWVRVQVVGTVAQPMPLIQPRIPLLDESFRGFMQALEGGQPGPGPPRIPRSGLGP